MIIAVPTVSVQGILITGRQHAGTQWENHPATRRRLNCQQLLLVNLVDKI